MVESALTKRMVEGRLTAAKERIMEEETQDSREEVATQGESDDSTHTQEAQNLEKESQQREEQKERDWRAMRQRQKEMELSIKQKDEIIEKFLQVQKAPDPVPVVEEVQDEDYVPAGKVKGIAKREMQPLEKKIADLDAKLKQHEQEKLINNFKRKFPDFDDVVNIETLELLEKKEPELAATIAQLKDPYTMGLQSYKYIKAFGIAEELPNAKRVKEVDKKLEKNSKAVQTPQAYDKRPMAQAFKSTAADQKRLYEEMMFYASQASGL